MSRVRSAVGLARSPIFFQMVACAKPGVSLGTTKAETAWKPAPGSSLAKSTVALPSPPAVIKRLAPLST